MNTEHKESEYRTLAQMDSRSKNPDTGTVIPTKQGVDDTKRFSEENEK